jgi:preprotein translocase subunit SecB
MSDTSTPPTGETVDVHTEALQQQIIIHAQYVRDLSFENPRVPDSLRNTQDAIKVDVGFNIATRKLDIVAEQQLYEVVLKLAATGKRGNDTVYVAEVEYGAAVTLPGAQENILRALLQVEVPRMIFPFARAQIFDVIQDGGHPPLLLPPIDFVGFFQQQMAQARQQQTQTA